MAGESLPGVFYWMPCLACRTEGISGMSTRTFLSFSFPSMSFCPITGKFLPFNFPGSSSTKGELWAVHSFRVQTRKCKRRCMVPVPLTRFPDCGEGHPDTFPRPAPRLELVAWTGHFTPGSPRRRCGAGRVGAGLAGELPPAAAGGRVGPAPAVPEGVSLGRLSRTRRLLQVSSAALR